MRFSVVIPVYNVEHFLRDCLESVLNQSFADWEAVCVNDGSTDGSAAILEEYTEKDSRFKVLSQPNGGLSAARNAGLKVAQGEYVIFLDSDDWLEPHALQTLSNNLDGEDMLCFSGRRFFEETGEFRPADQLTGKVYMSGMAYYNENALSFLVNNRLGFKVGVYHEDNLFTPKACCCAGKVRQIADCLYDYRVRANSIMTTTDVKRLRDLLGIANELAGFFIAQSGFDKTVVYRAITHHYQVAFVNVSKKDRKELKRLCDWKLYHKVSRTKLRHRVNYWKYRLAI